jgi:hypothetical protein
LRERLMQLIEENAPLKDRCCVCEKLDAAEFDYICAVQYEADKGMKELFLGKGFCNGHFWKIASLTSREAVSSMAILLLENGSPPTRGCLICEYGHIKEREFINGLREELDESLSGGNWDKKLCLPHLELISNGLERESREYLERLQRKHNERLLEELKGFLAKRENWSARTPGERTAWWRAIEKLVGRNMWESWKR